MPNVHWMATVLPESFQYPSQRLLGDGHGFFGLCRRTSLGDSRASCHPRFDVCYLNSTSNSALATCLPPPPFWWSVQGSNPHGGVRVTKQLVFCAGPLGWVQWPQPLTNLHYAERLGSKLLPFALPERYIWGFRNCSKELLLPNYHQTTGPKCHQTAGPGAKAAVLNRLLP